VRFYSTPFSRGLLQHVAATLVEVSDIQLGVLRSLVDSGNNAL
jgi:hypothetical protein